jgi:hypothetical protein
LFISAKINGIKRQCLIDSGASKNLCSEKVAQTLGSDVKKEFENFENLRGVTGNALPVVCEAKGVKIWLSNTPLVTDFYVIKELGNEK